MDEAGMGDGLQNRDDGSLLFFGFDDFACEFNDHKTNGQVLNKPLALSGSLKSWSSWSSLSSSSSDSSLEDDWDSPSPPLETLPRVMVPKAREERLVLFTDKPKKNVGKRFLQWLKRKLRCG